jgi:hypothetical protein
MRSRKFKAFEKEEIPPHEAAERRLEGSSQPVSTEASGVDFDEDRSEETAVEKTMEDYYSKTDVEGQGGIPSSPPDHDPMPLQDLRKPKGPPKHNM